MYSTAANFGQPISQVQINNGGGNQQGINLSNNIGFNNVFGSPVFQPQFFLPPSPPPIYFQPQPQVPQLPQWSPPYFPPAAPQFPTAGYPAAGGGQQDGGIMQILLLLLGGGGLGGLGGGGRARGRDHYEDDGHVHEQPEPRTVTKTTVNGGTTAKVWGDPHFVGFEGDKYDVMGQAGKTYNIISDKNLQYNAEFVGNGQEGITYLGTAGIKVGNDEVGTTKLEFSKGGGAPKVNGKELAKGETAEFPTGLKDEQGNPINGSATWDGTNFTVNTGEYQVKLTNKGTYLDQEVNVTNIGVRGDGVDPHGLLGQTADFDGKARKGKEGKGAQGEGAIEGVYTDYEVGGLFDDNFAYNRFGAQGKAGEFGVGAGKTGKAT